MFSWLARFAASCMRPVIRYRRTSKGDDDQGDPLLWCRDICRHSTGEFSFAVAQANERIEDQSQVETGSGGTFVGVYDGHGGPDASLFVLDHLFPHLMSFVDLHSGVRPVGEYLDSCGPRGFAQENGGINENVILSAFSATESGFLDYLRRTVRWKPLVAACGSCCLVGVIWDRRLYIANLGDSRAVMGSLGRLGKIVAEQLTEDHNASKEHIRQELRSLHPDDSQIVIQKHGVWRIKGIIQVSRSIGDAYLKSQEFALDPSVSRFRLSQPLSRPVLSAVPSIYTRDIRPQDKFIIFASDGLWEHLTNEQAVEIVHYSPRKGIARRLARTALQEAARKRETRYQDLKKIGKGIRRFFHDDITVVVLFVDHELLGRELMVPDVSARGFVDSIGSSDFSILGGINRHADGS